MDEIEINVKLAEHDRDLEHLKKQMETLNKMADEIHVMATNISTLTMELKHTNEHILSNDKLIEKTDCNAVVVDIKDGVLAWPAKTASRKGCRLPSRAAER